MVPHIRQLIATHDYGVIPQFGGFIGKYAPAHIHPGTHEFFPPNKSLAFNRNLTEDDGLLVQQLVKSTDLDANEARKAAANFAADLNQKLNRKEVVTLTGIGRIFQDVEGRVRFRQDDEAMLLPASYGLPRFKANPVLRQKLVDTGPTIKNEEDTVHTGRSIPAWIWAAASVAVVIALVFGSYLAIPGLQDQTNSLLGWNGDNAGQKVIPEGEMAYSGTINWNLNNFEKRAYPNLPEEVRKPYEVVVNSDIPTGYFIIVSSFQKRPKARELARKLQQAGKEAYLFPTAGNGFNRVGLFISGSNPYEVSQALSEIRANYRPDAWVVKNNKK